MATIKSFTSLEQAKMLEKILQPESADMCYIQDLLAGCKYGEYKPYIGNLFPAYGQDKIRCWSLAALLEQIPYELCDDDGNSLYLEINKEDDMYQLVYADTYGNYETIVNLLVYEDTHRDFENIETDRYEHFVDACYEMILKLNKLNLL